MWGLLLRAAALVAVLFVAGCGGGGSGDGDPATAVPADALFYAELVVRPEGALREDALDAAGKVLATDDPEARIRELMREAFADAGEDIDYERDLEPWLGERAAVWAAPSERAYDPTVVLLATTDAETARASLEAVLERGGHEVTERSHRDSEYLVDSSGVAAGIVDEFVAIGPEADYKRTVDAAEGDSLAEADGYADAVGALPDERLAHFWADTSRLFDLAMRDDPSLDRLRSLVPVGDLPAVAGAFLANGDRLALEIDARDDLGISGTPLLQELPGGTWAAAGSADVGESLRDALDRFGGAIGGAVVRDQVRREFGLDLDRDVLDWIGHTAVFVRGTETIDGGIVIQPTEEDRAAGAFGRIVGAIQQIRDVEAQPVQIAGADQAFAIEDDVSARPIVLARGSGLVVATVGEPAAEAALGSGDRLGERAAYAEAEELVGTEPSLLVSIPQVLELVRSDPEVAEARRYLEALTVVAAGGEEGTVRLAAGLR